MSDKKEHLVNIALGLLASKVDHGKLDISEALEQAYQINRKAEDEEPPTVRFPRVSSIPPKK